MAHNASKQNDEPPLRSLRDNVMAMVTFESRTTRKVDIFWLDYRGERVRYATMDPFDSFPILTFETHPWIFRDHETGAPVLAEGKEAYFPKPYNGGEQPFIKIHIPVYSLRTLSMMCIRQQKTDDVIKTLDIPRHLIPEILYKENIPHKEHLQF